MYLHWSECLPSVCVLLVVDVAPATRTCTHTHTQHMRTHTRTHTHTHTHIHTHTHTHTCTHTSTHTHTRKEVHALELSVCACLHTSDSAHHCVWLLYELLAEVAEGIAAVQGCGLVEEVLVGMHSHLDITQLVIVQCLFDATSQATRYLLCLCTHIPEKGCFGGEMGKAFSF